MCQNLQNDCFDYLRRMNWEGRLLLDFQRLRNVAAGQKQLLKEVRDFAGYVLTNDMVKALRAWAMSTVQPQTKGHLPFLRLPCRPFRFWASGPPDTAVPLGRGPVFPLGPFWGKWGS